ncbi:MAG: hypothetical protein ABSH36_00455 [Solirubrobacteraceae bacterium]
MPTSIPSDPRAPCAPDQHTRPHPELPAPRARSDSRERWPQSPWLHIARFGWTIHFPAQRTPYRFGGATLSHYGESWRGHLHELTADAIGTDARTVADEDIVRLSVSGPLGNPELPAGRIMRINAAPEPWRDTPTDGHDPRFGNAGALDYVALDVYVTILRRFGGRVFDPHRD